MKIKLGRSTAAAASLVMFILVAACAVLIAGTYVGCKTQKKFEELKKKREHDLATNGMDEARAQAIQSFGSHPQAQAFVLMLMAELPTNAITVTTLQFSTNLVDWEDAGDIENFGPEMAAGYTNGGTRFFRSKME